MARRVADGQASGVDGARDSSDLWVEASARQKARSLHLPFADGTNQLADVGFVGGEWRASALSSTRVWDRITWNLISGISRLD